MSTMDTDDMEVTQRIEGNTTLKKNWRCKVADLKSNLLTMLETGINSDMTFIVGEGKDCISAHKFILSLWSSAFEEMPDTVEIPEINPVAFNSFLKFLYTEEFETAPEDLMPVLCAAKKFNIIMLAEKCVSVLKSEIKASTAVSMYQAAKMLSEELLAEESLNYILKNGAAVIKEEDFLLLSHQNLSYLLERDDFAVQEVELFHAVCRWASKECEKEELEQTPDNHRAVLKGAIKLIRFPLLSAKEFAIHVTPSELLSDKEMIALLIQYAVPAVDREKLHLAHGFAEKERKNYGPPKKRPKITPKSEKAMVNGDVSGDADKENGMDVEWRKPKAGLKANLLTIFEEKIMTDITLLVGEKREKILAHKFILTLWSPMFEDMFYGSLASTTHDPLEILDVCPIAFKSFLKVLYTEDFDVPIENAMSVFFIAKTYDIPFVGENSLTLLKGSIADNTAVSVYQAAKVLGDETLEKTAFSHVLSRGYAVVKETDFLNLSYANLLEQNNFNVGETELFQATLRWANKELDKAGMENTPESVRSILKGAIQLIRFPLMSVKDFSLHVAPTEILSDKEMVGVLIYFSLPPSERANAVKQAFSSQQRMTVNNLMIKHELAVCNLSIMADRNVQVMGFAFSGLDANKVNYAPTCVYLYNSKGGISYATSFTETQMLEEGKERFCVKFRMPVPLKANEWYISSEMSLGRHDSQAPERESWVTVKSRQGEVNFEFQVHPVKEIEGVFQYAVPQVLYKF